jgi:glycosyltransferase involved in cell wall biosynthesis
VPGGELNRKTILIIVENLPVPLDRRVWQESLALRDAGYEVVVICPQMHGQVAPEEELDGIQIYRHPLSAEAKGFWGFFLEYASALWGETRCAWKAWGRHRFKVIHICNPPDLLFLVALPFKLLGVRVIYDVHDLWPEMFEAKFGGRRPFYWAVRLAERATYATADAVLATNDTVRSVAQRRGGKKPERVFMVRTAPKIPKTACPPDPGLKKGRPHLVGYVGVMGSADGVHLLLEAADCLVHQRKRGDIQFLLMGTGPEYERLLKLRTALGLEEWVDMPGWCQGEALFRALQTIDLGVSCDPKNSYNDACTMNKVLEYMAFGKPQVLFDLVESRASAGDAAWYVSPSSPEKLAEGIERLLDDPDLRSEMGRKARERFGKLVDWRRSVEQLERAYALAVS